jgi:hypothetical protein
VLCRYWNAPAKVQQKSRLTGLYVILRDHFDGAGRKVQGYRAPHNLPVRPKQVNPQCGLAIYKLQDGLAGRVERVHVPKQEVFGQRLRNAIECRCDKIHVVQRAG